MCPPRHFVHLLAALVVSASATAHATGAIEPDARAALQGKQALAQALLRIWGFEVYDATLYAQRGFDPSNYARERFGLELHYRRSFKGADIARRSIDEIRDIDKPSESQSAAWLQEMTRLFPDVQPGDRILGVHVPGSGARFYLNGRLLGEVSDVTFSERFFGIWLSPQTSQPRFRETLLAQLRN